MPNKRVDTDKTITPRIIGGATEPSNITSSFWPFKTDIDGNMYTAISQASQSGVQSITLNTASNESIYVPLEGVLYYGYQVVYTGYVDMSCSFSMSETKQVDASSQSCLYYDISTDVFAISSPETVTESINNVYENDTPVTSRFAKFDYELSGDSADPSGSFSVFVIKH